MLSENQKLKELLAKGNLEAALKALVRFSQHSDDADLRQRVLTLSGQFSMLKNQQLTGLLEDTDYRLQLNRITAALVDIANSLQVLEKSPVSERSKFWKKLAAILAVLASMAGVTGYTLRNYFWPPEPMPQELPPAEPLKKDTLLPAAPVGKPTSGIRNKEKPTAAQKAVEVKLEGDVINSNIIIGDGNQVKQ